MPDSQRIDVFIHLDHCADSGSDVGGKLDEFIAQVYPKLDFLISQTEQFAVQLKTLQETGDKILMTEQEALAVLDKIDTTTNKMSATQQSDADLLQKISDEIDALVAAGGIPPTVATRLGALADTIQKVSDNGDAQATILTAIAAKGKPPVPPTPVPTPVPSV